LESVNVNTHPILAESGTFLKKLGAFPLQLDLFIRKNKEKVREKKKKSSFKE